MAGMLSVPTLWVVFIVNFLALGLIWTYVARSYPKFGAARFWSASTFIAVGGASVSLFRGIASSPALPLLLGGTLMIVDFEPHTLEFLRDEQAHRRLGFSTDQISGWVSEAGGAIADTRAIAGPRGGAQGRLGVGIWVARIPAAGEGRA